MKVTSTSPLRIATPLSAMNPMAELTVNGMPRAHNATTPPTAPSGIPVATMNTSRSDVQTKVKQDQNHSQGHRNDKGKLCIGPFHVFKLATPFNGVTPGQLHLFRDLLLRFFGDKTSHVSSSDVALDGDPPFAPFTVDGGRALGLHHLSQLIQRKHRPGSGRDQCRRQRFRIRPLTVRHPHHERKTALSFPHFSHLARSHRPRPRSARSALPPRSAQSPVDPRATCKMSCPTNCSPVNSPTPWIPPSTFCTSPERRARLLQVVTVRSLSPGRPERRRSSHSSAFRWAG